MALETKGRIFSLLFILVLFFSIIDPCVFPAKASPLTTVTLELQGNPPEVDVSPGSPGIAEVAGNISCLKVGPDDVKVSLQGDSDLGSAPVSPPSFVFSGMSGSEETRPFIASTRVPMGYSSSETPILTVGGYYDQGGLRTNIAPVSQSITILQYYQIEYRIENKRVTVDSGENTEIKFIMANVGNGDDTFEIDFKNREHLQGKGFNLPAPFEVQMLEDENKSVSLDIGAPDDNSGRFVAEISILSKGSLSGDYPKQVILYIFLKVEGGFGEQIGAVLTSPLTILLIVIMIVVAFFLRQKHKKRISSIEN